MRRPNEVPPRVAPLSAVGSTAATIVPDHTPVGNYPTEWNYREGYVATEDSVVARLVGVGFASFGLAALINAIQGPPEPPELPDGETGIRSVSRRPKGRGRYSGHW